MKKLKDIKSCMIQICFKHINCLIFLFFIVSIFFVYKGNEKNVFYHFSLAFISSLIFYTLVNYVLEKRRMQILKGCLDKSYKKIKGNILTKITFEIFKDIKTCEKLLDHKEFRKTFGNGNTYSRWDFFEIVCSKDATYIKYILDEFEPFSQVLDIAILLYPPKNSKDYNAFKDIQSKILSIKNLDLKPSTYRNELEHKLYKDGIESFCKAVYCILAHAHFNNRCVEFHDNDFIQDYINTL